MSKRGRIWVVAGCTATGKSALAVELAQRFDGEVIGADSVQVYRGFDIGSAKPTDEEMRGVPHHLIDIVDPDALIDAMEFAQRADRVIEAVHARGRIPIVVAGTGLWIRALVRGLVDLPPVDAALRARLLEEGERMGRPALHERLAKVDPLAAAKIHPNDLVRVSRALEVFEQTGTPLGNLRAEHALGGDRYDSFFLVLQRSEDHDARIDTRLDAMVEAGWKEETAALLDAWAPSCRPFGSVGYAQMVEHLREGIPWDETRKRIRKATRVYARRQRTWFGSEPGIDWHATYDAASSPEGLARFEDMRSEDMRFKDER